MSTEQLTLAKTLSRFAWGFIVLFIICLLLSQPIIAGFFIVLGAVCFMNGLGRTDLLRADTRWWQEHPVMRYFHFWTSEGELAGIITGAVVWLTLYLIDKEALSHIHMPWTEAFTLLGIMSMANLIVANMKTIMALIERFSNRWVVVFFGSILSSVTGEPAAAIFLSDYIYNRVPEEKHAKTATSLAASIGSGGGLLPFAAPPILIVWPYLQSQLGWSILDLVMYVAVGCILHAAVSATYVARYMRKDTRHSVKNVPMAVVALTLMAVLVAMHIAHFWLVYYIDVVIAVLASGFLFWQYTKQIKEYVDVHGLHTRIQREKNSEFVELKERRFSAVFQPVILAGLLIALEIIGVAAEPFIGYLAELIPTTLPLFAVGLMLFFATAWVSHFADNALASRVFIVIALGFIGTHGAEVASVLAACVLYGALFGGFLTIPANLPNFAINRRFKVDPKPWIQAAVPLYITVVVYVMAIALQFWLHL